MNDMNKLKCATRAKIARTELRALKFYSSRPLSYFGTGQGSDFGDLLGAFCLGLVTFCLFKSAARSRAPNSAPSRFIRAASCRRFVPGRVRVSPPPWYKRRGVISTPRLNGLFPPPALLFLVRNSTQALTRVRLEGQREYLNPQPSIFDLEPSTLNPQP